MSQRRSKSAADPSATCDLTPLFSPRGIAVVGASEDPRRIGGQPVHALASFGYAGAVYPVNPNRSSVQGLASYPDVKSVPKPCDVALIALPAESVPALIRQCGEAGIPYAIVLSTRRKPEESDWARKILTRSRRGHMTLSPL